jgi:acetyl-CoA/propionyl-CoA carboxylase biotin carboxyl carrier protein
MLAAGRVLGLDTNLAFLRDLLALPEMQEGRVDVGLIDRLGGPHAEELTPKDRVIASLFRRGAGARSGSPWEDDGWRAGHAAPAPSATLTPLGGTAYRLTAEGRSETVHVAADPDGTTVWVHRDGHTRAVDAPDRATALARRLAAAERTSGPVSPEVRAAMPGTVVQVAVGDGDTVEAGALLATVEAMKMEHSLTAPLPGTVRIALQPGQLVRRDQVVATIETPATPQEVS